MKEPIQIIANTHAVINNCVLTPHVEIGIILSEPDYVMVGSQVACQRTLETVRFWASPAVIRELAEQMVKMADAAEAGVAEAVKKGGGIVSTEIDQLRARLAHLESFPAHLDAESLAAYNASLAELARLRAEAAQNAEGAVKACEELATFRARVAELEGIVEEERAAIDRVVDLAHADKTRIEARNARLVAAGEAMRAYCSDAGDFAERGVEMIETWNAALADNGPAHGKIARKQPENCTASEWAEIQSSAAHAAMGEDTHSLRGKLVRVGTFEQGGETITGFICATSREYLASLPRVAMYEAADVQLDASAPHPDSVRLDWLMRTLIYSDLRGLRNAMLAAGQINGDANEAPILDRAAIDAAKAAQEGQG